VMGVEKELISKMLVEGTNRRLHNVDYHIGVVRALLFKRTAALCAAPTPHFSSCRDIAVSWQMGASW
jgi:hypothetical protein